MPAAGGKMRSQILRNAIVVDLNREPGIVGDKCVAQLLQTVQIESNEFCGLNIK
jgi:hypothetical protein